MNQFDFEPTLFHHPSHLHLQIQGGWKWYYVIHPANKKIVASLYLHIKEHLAQSCVRSPFGTIEHSPNIPPEILFRFLDFIHTSLRKLTVNKIVIKTPPLHYGEGGSLLQTFLFNYGYHVIDAEVGSIGYTNREFIHGLNQLEKRKLKKSEKAALHFNFISHNKFEEVYSFIAECRERKGYLLSMTLEELSQTIKQFKDRFLLASVFHGGELAAASICVRVSSKILYVFYVAHSAAYDHLSPVVLLVKGLFNYCQESKIELLDFGTSAVNGQPNFGLLNFKLGLGAVPSSKLTYEKILTP